jgi:hypothetical protein
MGVAFTNVVLFVAGRRCVSAGGFDPGVLPTLGIVNLAT